MNKETDLPLLSLILPEGLLTYFTIVGFDKKPIKDPLYVNRLTIYLEEKKEIPEAYKNHQYKASGFMEPRIIEDYPIRDNLVSLSLKRR
ncbi:ISAon1 family transposase N-terminal region protein, partial [Marixanthomonas spongiae]